MSVGEAAAGFEDGGSSRATASPMVPNETSVTCPPPGPGCSMLGTAGVAGHGRWAEVCQVK